MKLNKYAAAEITGPLPAGITATATLTIKLKAKCTACGETHELEEETDGKFNAPFAIQHKMRFTTVKTNRDKRTYYNMEFLLCPDCNKTAQDFMAGKINLKEEPLENH
jgi:ribosomal protein L44E